MTAATGEHRHAGARRIAGNAAALLAGSAGRMLLSIALQIMVARHFGAIGLGKYALLLAFLTIFQTVSEFGLPILTVREAARSLKTEVCDERATAGRYLFAAMTPQLVLALVAWLGMGLLGAALHYPAETQRMLWIGGASLPAYAVTSATTSALQALQRMTPVAGLDVMAAALTLALTLAAIALGMGPVTLAVVVLASQTLMAIVALVVAGRLGLLTALPRGAGSAKHWLPLTRSLLAGAPAFFLLTAAVAAFSRLDLVMLSRLGSEAEVGVYQAAFLVVNAANLAFGSYGTAAFPRLAQLFRDDPARFRQLGPRVASHALVLSLPVSAGAMLLAGPIIALLYNGGEYAGSPAVLRIVSWYAVPFALNLVLSRFLLGSDRQRMSLAVAVIKLVVAFAAYFVLIRSFGIQGAAVATVLAATFGTALNWVYVDRHIVRLDLWSLGFRPLLATLGMSAILYGLLRAGVHVVPTALAGALAYAALLIALRGIGPEDAAALRALVQLRSRP